MAKKYKVIDYKKRGIGGFVVLSLPTSINLMQFICKEIMMKMPADKTIHLRTITNPTTREITIFWDNSYDHNHFNALLNRIRRTFPNIGIKFETPVAIRR